MKQNKNLYFSTWTDPHLLLWTTSVIFHVYTEVFTVQHVQRNCLCNTKQRGNKSLSHDKWACDGTPKCPCLVSDCLPACVFDPLRSNIPPPYCFRSSPRPPALVPRPVKELQAPCRGPAGTQSGHYSQTVNTNKWWGNTRVRGPGSLTPSRCYPVLT